MSLLSTSDSKAWNEILTLVRPHTGEIYFTRWLSASRVREDDGIRLLLEVPNYMAKVWVESNFLNQLGIAVRSVLGSPREIEIVLAEGASAPLAATEPKPVMARRTTAAAKKNISPEDFEDRLRKSGLSQQYTFQNFVVGEHCQFSHASAEAVAERPAQVYNPLFLYGGTGLGKTHLMQAIGHRMVSKRPDMQVVYMSAEKFTNEFIEALRAGKLKAFRDRYRKVDAMLIDDIQFLAGKDSTQEEFFHTFNELLHSGRQMVLTSDRPPSEISKLENRLVSRFEWGLTAEMQAPRMETRIAILRMKMQNLGVPISDTLVNYLAGRIHSNVRRLEGALTRVASLVSLHHRQPPIEEVELHLKDILQEEAKRQVTVDRIQKKVADHFDIRLADMTSRKRPAHIAFPRQIAMYLARELTNNSLVEIGEVFGGRDHGTVIHAHKRVVEQLTKDEKLRQDIASIRRKLEFEPE